MAGPANVGEMLFVTPIFSQFFGRRNCFIIVSLFRFLLSIGGLLKMMNVHNLSTAYITNPSCIGTTGNLDNLWIAVGYACQ